jgi:hypothetical protein
MPNANGADCGIEPETSGRFRFARLFYHFLMVSADASGFMIDRRYYFLGLTSMVTSTSGHRHGSDQKDDNTCQ